MHMQACTHAQKRNTHDTHTLHTQLIHIYIHKHHKSYTCKLSFAQTQSRRCRSKLKLWRSLHTYSDLFGRLNLCSSCIAFRHDLQVLKITWVAWTTTFTTLQSGIECPSTISTNIPPQLSSFIWSSRSHLAAGRHCSLQCFQWWRTQPHWPFSLPYTH